MEATQTGDNADEVVRLSVPASLEHIRIVRLTASGVASRLGFDVDDIENLRIAVDELTSTVIDATAGGVLDVTFSSGAGELRIDGRAPMTPGADLALDELSGQILNAVCDKYEVRANDGYARFVCVRRLPAG